MTGRSPILPRHGALPETAAVPDILAPGLRLVFCGTALGRVSAERRAYYANPTNAFWRTLHATGLTARQLRPDEHATLPAIGIGLTDLCKTHYGNDAELPADAFDLDALAAKIARFRPQMLAFTSKTAASAVLRRPTGRIVTGRQAETLSGSRIWVLPSPSGQARRSWDGAAWQALADWFHAG
jgi:TDG/mug DNA glycosylase family protein